MEDFIHPHLQQLAGAFTAIPFNRILGLKLDHLDANEVTMSFEMKSDLIGNFMHQILHGGVISSVLDMAGGMVIMAHAIIKHADADIKTLQNMLATAGTVDLQISYLNPGRGELFTAKATLIKSGNLLSYTRMELFNQDKLLIATGSGTYLIK